VVFATNSAQAQTFKTLYTFTGISSDGALPWNSPLLDVNGTLYGATTWGGVNLYGPGTLYKLDSKGKETVLYNFCSFANCADGALPESNVVQDWQGNLYGVALVGGNMTNANCTSYNYQYGCGTVFKLDKKKNFTVLYTFTGGADGNVPQGLTMDLEGNLYGITLAGGDLNCPIPNTLAPGCGVVFKVDTKGNFTVLYTFTGGADGGVPNDYLTLDWAGNIYGVTWAGGNPADCTQYGETGCGTVFKLDKKGKLTTLYTFTGLADGWGNQGSLVLDLWGNLYGATSYGGDLTCYSGTGCGVLYKLTAAGKYSVLHTFAGTPDGANPPMGLIGDLFGNLYGVTQWGGNSADCTWGATNNPPSPPGCGTVFKLDARGDFTVLYTFTGLADGASPGSGLTMDLAGNLYGNTELGGDFSCAYSANGCGVVYKLEPGK